LSAISPFWNEYECYGVKSQHEPLLKTDYGCKRKTSCR